MNFGKIGFFIGHGIQHAFDTNGRLMDEKGNPIDWISTKDAREFSSRRKCLIDNHSEYVLTGLPNRRTYVIINLKIFQFQENIMS